jgi:adenine-specific DNA-methyltransferase
MSDGSGIVKIDLDKVDWRGSREFFESLAAALEKLDDKDECYDFTWVGKRKAIIEAGVPINKTFRPDAAASKDWDSTENLFIEGDNLDALKLLQESYLGKVKMIYIDPPYNTGRDFVYHDNFKASVDQYDEDTEYRDEAGNIQFKKNEKSNGRYPSDWLSMMYPRLKLARNLLTDDGVIFISIDDNEQANLKKLCDEIFGEDNFVADLIWKNKNGGGNDAKYIAVEHEYVLMYSRFIEKLPKLFVDHSAEYSRRYNEQDDQGRYYWDTFRRKSGKQYYPITCPDGSIMELDENGNPVSWLRSETRFLQDLKDGEARFTKVKDGWSVQFKQREPEGKKPRSIISDQGTTSSGSGVALDLFKCNVFDNPKPISLIKFLAGINTGRNDIILDFFSGSATTAHAVMQLSADDGNNRKWIMVQLPEETDEKSEAHKAGYKTIPEIARERIRRAGDKIASEYPEAKVDYGFRALTIADTNYKDIFRSAGQLHQADLLADIDNVKDDRADLDLLYGVLTQSALELNRPISTTEISGATIYQYDYFGEVSGLIACFAKDVPEEVIKAIAALKPLTAVFRDSSFANSQAKVNLSEHFRILSPDTKVKVI